MQKPLPPWILQAEWASGCVLMSLLYFVLSLAFCCLPLVCQLPEWIVTTWIGASWGVLFLSGLAASWVAQRTSWLIHCGLNAMAVQCATCLLTDLGSHTCWLLAILLLGSGWLMGVTLIPWENGRRVPGRVNYDAGQAGQFNCSIWDILCATTLVGLLCWLVPRAEFSFDLLCQMAPAYFAGLILSVIAVPLAWRNQWTASQWFSLAVSSAVTLGLVCVWMLNVPGPVTLTWVLQGPLVVAAAQFFIVLAGLGLTSAYSATQPSMQPSAMQPAPLVEALPASASAMRLHLFNGDFQAAHLDADRL